MGFDYFIAFAGVVIFSILILTIRDTLREPPEQMKRRLELEAQERVRRQEELEARKKANIEQRERTKAAKREKRKEVLGRAAASPFAAAGIAAGVTKAAYDHTKKHFGPESETDTFCPQCGTEMDLEYRYCPKCGSPSIRRTKD